MLLDNDSSNSSNDNLPNNCIIGCSTENMLVDKSFQDLTIPLLIPPLPLLVILPRHDRYPFHCQGFTGRTPARVRDGSLPKGLNEYPTQLPRLGQLRTRVGSKSLVMQDYKRLPRLIMAPDYFRNPWREMSQVATRTFNVLYYFPFIWFNGSHYPRSYI